MLAGPDEQESATIKKAATNQGHGSSRVQKLALHFCAGVVRLLMRPIARIEIPDLAVQPQAGEGLIIAANHRSMLDMFVGLITFSKWKLYPHMLVRGDLCHLPIIGWLLRKLGAIPAGRGHSSVRHAKSLLNQGRVLVLTPEGRIVSQEERIRGVGELKPGIGYLSAAHGTPILLVAVTNTDSCWPLGARFPRFRLSPRRRPVIRISAEMMAVEAGADIRHTVHEVGARLSRLLTECN
jgi:1-acyl-sn-glycerol-3-phosphate acyltransferase